MKIVVRVLLWLAVRLLIILPGFLVALAVKYAGGALLWLLAFIWRHGIRGEHRAKFFPVWIQLAAGLSLVVPAAEVWWALLAAAIVWTPDRWFGFRNRVWLSARERDLTGRACAGVSLTLLTGLAGWPWWAVLIEQAAACAAFAWWWIPGRTKRPTAEPLILARWRDEVVTQVPDLDGFWKEFNDEAGAGVLKLSNALASSAAKLDEQAEWALDQPRGTVTISADPRLTTREVRVAFTQPGEGGRLKFWDGPSLDRKGRFVVGYAKGGLPIYGRLWKPDGAVHIAVVGASGSGKGSIQRLIVLEAAMSSDVLALGVDGKGGKGLGYARAGFTYLATARDEWGPLIAGVHAEMERREDDTNDDDSFVARPGVPRILLMVDEMKKVVRQAPSAARHLEEIAARGRSLGVGICLAMQKGDGPSYGGTETRHNVLGNGWLWAGVADDAQAKITMTQTFDFDPASLPDEPGWSGVMGRCLGPQPVLPTRTLWIPNRLDIKKAWDDDGLGEDESCPFGALEGWLERDTIHPELLPEALTALGLDEMPEPAEQAPDNVAQISAAPSAPAKQESAGWRAIKDALRSKGPMRRGDIAKETGLHPRTVSEHLAAHEGAEVVSDPETQKWSLAA